MFGNLSIQKKLYAAFGMIVLLLLLLLFAAHNSFSRLNDANRWDRHTLQVLVKSHAMETSIFNMQAEYRGFLLTGNESFITRFSENERSLRELAVELRRMTSDNPSQQQLLLRIENAANGWLGNIVRPLMDKRRDITKSTGTADVLGRDPLFLQGASNIAQLHDLFDQFNAEENRLLTERASSAVSLNQTMFWLLSLGGLTCFLAALTIAVLLARSISGPLLALTDAVDKIARGNTAARAAVFGKDEIGQVAVEFNRMAATIEENMAREKEQNLTLRNKVDSVLAVVTRAAAGDLTGRITVSGDDAIGRLGTGLATMFDNLRILLDRVQKAGIQVTTSTTEIAASARQQESTGIEQAQTSVEVLSTTKEISANTAQLLKAMKEVADVAEDTAASTGEAQTNLRRMDHSMQRMVNATDSINAKLASLSEKASNINNVLVTITKVADQTNILSLNAAIEAEKAGEAGRGFSVVATEIRRLADQTSVATWDIEQMLKEMQSAVSASVMGMDKFSEEIRRNVDETRRVGEGLSEVIDQVQKLTPRFEMVVEGMQSQAVGAAQITETMTQLNETTQQAVDALKAATEAVQQLQYAAQDLQAGVSNFAVNI